MSLCITRNGADNENRAQEAEAAKQEQLKKVKQGTNEWHNALATNSEEDVRRHLQGFGDYVELTWTVHR